MAVDSGTMLALKTRNKAYIENTGALWFGKGRCTWRSIPMNKFKLLGLCAVLADGRLCQGQ